MLRTLSQRKRRAYYERQVGREVQVLFETEKDGMVSGFSENYVRVAVLHVPGIENTILPVRIDRLDRGVVHGTLMARPTRETSFIALPVINTP